MNISQLEVLAAIADTGSFTAAAESVGLTQSAVSSSLAKLESELGVRLLERGRRGVRATAIGETVLPRARAVLQQVEGIRQDTWSERGLAVGKVRLGCIPHIPARLLTGMVQDFRNRYPGMSVIVFQGSSDEIEGWLESGIIDIGTVPDSTRHRQVAPLATSEMHALLPASHPLAQSDRVDLGAVLREPLIGAQSELSALRAMFEPRVRGSLNIRHQVSEFRTAFAMVAEGWGVSLLPAMLIDDDLHDLVSRPLRPSTSMRAYLAATVESPAVMLFLATASSWAHDHGFWAG
jgi:DNA-binding transcriptional LysR family regulator